MKRAIELAERGRGWTSPNPMVGAVLVRDGQIIGEGWHARCGGLHAERHAISRCTDSPVGADLYVTLEPCCHYGKQPPCTDAIIESEIRRVFIGSSDPNPLVAGKGVQILQEHGIEVVEHVMEAECDALNPVFFHYIRTKRPYVVLKYAMTMDGKIACHTGESRWVTGEEARAHVQLTRHWLSGIMVGVGTVLTDDPMLTCRIEGGKSPVRIICDTHLRTPLEAQVVATAKRIPTILATCSEDPEQKRPYEEAGCQVLTCRETDGHVDLSHLMELLGQMEIDSILLEGGGTLTWSALQSGIVQRIQAYIAPKLFGGKDAKTPVEGTGFSSPAEAVHLKNTTITCLGEDFLLESEVDAPCSQA